MGNEFPIRSYSTTPLIRGSIFPFVTSCVVNMIHDPFPYIKHKWIRESGVLPTGEAHDSFPRIGSKLTLFYESLDPFDLPDREGY